MHYSDKLVGGPTPNKALFKELVAHSWGLWCDDPSVFSGHNAITFSIVVIVTTWQGDLTRACCEGGVGEKVTFTDM